MRCSCGGVRHKCDITRIAELEAGEVELQERLDDNEAIIELRETRIADLEQQLDQRGDLAILSQQKERIAELEAKVAEQMNLSAEQYDHGVRDGSGLLAALEAQTCTGCQRAYTDCSRRVVLVNDDTIDIDSCSEWTSHAEEGGKCGGWRILRSNLLEWVGKGMPARGEADPVTAVRAVAGKRGRAT